LVELIEHHFSRTRTPKDNTHIERFNRTLKEQFLPGNLTPEKVFSLSLAVLKEYLKEYLKDEKEL